MRQSENWLCCSVLLSAFPKTSTILISHTTTKPPVVQKTASSTPLQSRDPLVANRIYFRIKLFSYMDKGAQFIRRHSDNSQLVTRDVFGVALNKKIFQPDWIQRKKVYFISTFPGLIAQPRYSNQKGPFWSPEWSRQTNYSGQIKRGNRDTNN